MNDSLPTLFNIRKNTERFAPLNLSASSREHPKPKDETTWKLWASNLNLKNHPVSRKHYYQTKSKKTRYDIQQEQALQASSQDGWLPTVPTVMTGWVF